jgi:hypothetical protein
MKYRIDISLKDGVKDIQSEARATGVRQPEPHRVPLSGEAQDARQPQAPTHLLEAEQTRPNVPAKARTVRAKRSS